MYNADAPASPCLKGKGTEIRSKTPEVLWQEFWGLLLAHFAVRGLMEERGPVAAAAGAAGSDSG